MTEADRIELLVGVSAASLAAMGRAQCADCHAETLKNGMWYVPWRTRAICRPCRDWRVERNCFDANRTRVGDYTPPTPPLDPRVHYGLDERHAACGATKNFAPLAPDRPRCSMLPDEVTCTKCRVLIGS